MKTIQTELQKIADAIKGAESEEGVKTTQDLLAEIRDNIAGTTPSGEVKNMQVLLGEIAQAISDNPPSPEPSEAFEVVLNSSDGETFTPDKTFAETVAAMQNQTPVTMKMRFEIGGQTSEQVASFFYNAVEPESINAIYIPVYFTSSSINGFIWNENGFGTSTFNASITII